MYHAGKTASEREETQLDWLISKKPIIVATVAFGMGIDKNDVRYIIHYDIPSTIEGYYQESGRAGRDGKNSQCVILYNPDDLYIILYYNIEKYYNF